MRKPKADRVLGKERARPTLHDRDDHGAVRYEACGTQAGVYRTCGHGHFRREYAEWCKNHNAGIYTDVREIRS